MIKLKKTVIIFLALILVMPAMILFNGITDQSIYSETYYAELAHMTKRLYSAKKPKLIVVGGSNVAFGLNVQLMEDILHSKGYDYTVCSYGLYGAVGTSAMLSLSEGALKDEDIVILSIEPTSETLSSYFGASAFLKCAEDTPSLFMHLSSEQKQAVVGNYIPFLQEKESVIRSGQLPDAADVYSLSAFDDSCSMVYDRLGNIMALGFDIDQPVDFTSVAIEDSFAEQVNKYCQKAAEKGTKVYFSFCPVNRSCIADSDEDAIYSFYKLCDETFDCKIISNPKRYIMESGWFYDSNFHLNSEGAKLRTQFLAEDILAQLGCYESAEVPAIKMPDSAYAANVSDKALDTSDFCFESVADGNGFEITGLSQSGLSKECLEFPSSFEGKPVVSFSSRALDKADALVELTIPESITSIPESAFKNSTNLKRLVLLHESFPCGINDNSFDGADDLRVYVPKSSYPMYRDGYGCEANPWTPFLNRIYTY